MYRARLNFLASFFYASVALTVVACRSEKKPSGVIPFDKMEAVLYDYHCAQSMAEVDGDSTEYRRYLYIHSVFQKHHITEAQFDSSMIWYSADAAQLELMYQHINERMEKEMGLYAVLLDNSGADYYGTLSQTGDTANIWRGRDFYFLRAGTLENRMTFTLPADSSFQIGDSILWQFEPMFVVQNNGGRNVYSGMSVQYEDTIVSVQSRITSDGRVDLFIKPVPNKNIQKINGFVYYATQQQSDEEKFRAVVLRNIHLVRFHRQLSDSLSADTLALPDSLINDSLKQTMPVDSILLQDSVKSMDLPAGGRHQGSPIDYKRKRKR